MRRSTSIPIILILSAVGIVAIVKAQEWNAWSQLGDPAQAPSAQLARADVAANFAHGIGRSQPSETNRLSGRLQTLREADPNQPQRLVVQDAVGLPSGDNLPANQAPPSYPSTDDREPQLPPLRVDRPTVAVDQSQAFAANESADLGGGPGGFLVAQTDAELPARGQSSRRSHSPQEAAPRTIDLPAASAETRAAPTKDDGSQLIVARGPVLAVRTTGSATITVGKAASYEVEIVNSGTVDAEDVSVFVDLPQWADVAATEASLGNARFETIIGENGRIKWSMFRLEAGGKEQLKLDVVPRQSRSFDLAVSWTYAPSTSIAHIDVQEPKLEMTMSGPSDVLYGESKTYTVTVANPGSGPAENVVVNLLPITPGQESGGVSKIGTLGAGERKVIEIELTARQVGDLEIRAQAFADGGLRTQASQQIHVRRAELEALVTGPPIKYAGTVASFQIRVGNTGDALAERVQAEAILPRGAQFVAASDGGIWNEEHGRVQWQIGSLRPGSSRVYEVRCVLAEPGANRLEALTTASDDLTATGNAVTRVEALADLKMLINDPQGPVPTGEPTVYEVRIMNRGTKAAERVQVAAFFSEGIEPLSVEGGAAEIGVGQVVLQPIARIGAGQQLVFKITAKAEQAGNHTFRTEVVCASPETTLAAQETTRFYAATAAGQPAGEAASKPPTRTSRFGRESAR